MPMMMMNSRHVPQMEDPEDEDMMMMKEDSATTLETDPLEAYASSLLEPEEEDIDDDLNEDSFLADSVEDLDNIIGELHKELRSSTTTASLTYLRDSMAGSSLGDSSDGGMGSSSLRSSSRRRLGIRAESSRAMVEKEKQTEQEALEEYRKLFPLQQEGEDEDEDEEEEEDVGSDAELEDRLEKLHNIKSETHQMDYEEELGGEMTMAQLMRKQREMKKKNKNGGCLLGVFTAPFRLLAKPFKKKKKVVDELNQVRHGGVAV